MIRVFADGFRRDLLLVVWAALPAFPPGPVAVGDAWKTRRRAAPIGAWIEAEGEAKLAAVGTLDGTDLATIVEKTSIDRGRLETAESIEIRRGGLGKGIAGIRIVSLEPRVLPRRATLDAATGRPVRVVLDPLAVTLIPVLRVGIPSGESRVRVSSVATWVPEESAESGENRSR
jgi:hypothetical protein